MILDICIYENRVSRIEHQKIISSLAMSIHIYNSLTRKKEEFLPLNQPQIKMYACGPTVYDEPHIGHARSAYVFDIIKRYLEYKGYKVLFVRNVTDVDDKIIDKARKEFKGEDLNIAFKKVADKYLLAYHQALEKLEINSGDSAIVEPKASEYIEKMVLFIEGLIDKGAAYSCGGDVYFDITKAKDYGKLSHQSLDKMEVGSRVSPGENKRNPLDFALWKSAKTDEPSWVSPWGKGRPGWHIECSVMSSDILGDEFDIHGGGLDLIFPHHENEIAQSEGAGKKFARYWIHHGLLTINGQKMSKSLGNFVTVLDFLTQYKSANILKLLFLSTHYAHPVDYTADKIEEAKAALERISILIAKEVTSHKLQVTSKNLKEIEEIKDEFIKAMDDDFNAPQGLGAVFKLINFANKNSEDAVSFERARDTLIGLLKILGITIEDSHSFMEKRDDLIPLGIEAVISERNEARKNKDYALSDKIRKEWELKGIIFEDTKDGKTTWRKKP